MSAGMGWAGVGWCGMAPVRDWVGLGGVCYVVASSGLGWGWDAI